jgi:membrane protein
VGKDVRVIERLRPLLAWFQRLSLEYQRTRVSLAAGGMAYFVALSLAPAALAFGTLAGVVLDPEDVRAALERLADRAPASLGNLQPIVDALVAMVEDASASAFTITTLVSLLIAVYASSKVVFGLRQAMNTVFGVEETRSGLVERAFSAVVTLVGLVLGVAAVILLTVVPRVLEWLGVEDVRLTTGTWALDWAIALAAVFLAVRWTLRHAPNRTQPVGWLSRGAWVGTLGIGAATVGVGIYARFSASLSAAVLVFGTAVVILLWLYLCFLALLWGAIVEADAQRDDDGRRAGVRTRTTSADPPPAP